MILSKAKQHYCLYPKLNENTNAIDEGSVLGIRTKCFHSWHFTQDQQQLRFGASSFVLYLDEDSTEQKNVRLGSMNDETKQSKWTFQQFE